METFYCYGKHDICKDNSNCHLCESLDGSGGYYAKTDNNNPYWERIEALAARQRAKGMETYGQGLEMNYATIVERLNHLEEELIDALYYIEWIKGGLNEIE